MVIPTPLIVSRSHRTLHVCTLSGTPYITTRSPPNALHWFPSGHLLAEATQSGKLLFHPDNFSALAGEIDLTQTSSSSRVTCISISTGSRFLALGRADGVVSVLDLVSKQPITTFSLGAPVVAIAFQRTSDSRYIACATARAISLFSRHSNRLVSRYLVSAADHTSSFITPRESRAKGSSIGAVKITAIAFSPQHRNLLVAADESGCVNVWDITKNLSSRSRTEPHLQTIEERGATYSRFTSAMRTPASDMTFAPTGSAVSLCVGGFDKQLRFFDPSLKRYLFSVTCAAPVSAVSFATDSEHLAVGLTNGIMAVWKIDAEEKSGKLLTQVCVDGAEEDGAEEEREVSSVRSVHIQPMDMYDVVSRRNSRQLKNTGKGSMRPPPLAGQSSWDSLGGNSAVSPALSRLSTIDTDPPPLGIDDDNEEELDLDTVGLDVVADSNGEAGGGKMRHQGPRDSDIFSPVARRQSKKPIPSGGNVPTKASSFHETPRNERRAHITFRTPRSRTVQTLISAKEAKGSSTQDNHGETESTNVSRVVLSQARRARLQKNGMIDLDSDSLDSISGKSPPKDGSRYTSQGDVAQLHGSTVSEDGGRDSRECSVVHDSEQESFLSPNSGTETELSSPLGVDPHQSLTSHPAVSRTNIPRSSSEGGLLRKLSGSNSLESNCTRGRHGIASEQSTQLEDKPKPHPRNGDNYETASSRSRLSGGLISQYQPTALVEGKVGGGEFGAEEKREGLVGLAEELRLVIAQELDLVRFELRRDILNIHSEMVVMSAKQSQELQAAFVDRDRRVKQLEQEVVRLKQENQRLRRKHGLGL